MALIESRKLDLRVKWIPWENKALETWEINTIKERKSYSRGSKTYYTISCCWKYCIGIDTCSCNIHLGYAGSLLYYMRRIFEFESKVGMRIMTHHEPHMDVDNIVYTRCNGMHKTLYFQIKMQWRTF